MSLHTDHTAHDAIDLASVPGGQEQSPTEGGSDCGNEALIRDRIGYVITRMQRIASRYLQTLVMSTGDGQARTGGENPDKLARILQSLGYGTVQDFSHDITQLALRRNGLAETYARNFRVDEVTLAGVVVTYLEERARERARVQAAVERNSGDAA